MTPRQKLMLALPIIALSVIILVYFRLFTSPLVVVTIFVLYVVVSLMNRRKFRRERQAAGNPPKRKGSSVYHRV